MDGTRHEKFCIDRFRGFCYPNTWFYRAFGATSFFFVFGFFSKATAYTPKRIFTPEDVVPGKEVPFGDSDNGILYLDPQIPKTAILGIDFDLTVLHPKIAFIWGMLQYKLPLIVVVAP